MKYIPQAPPFVMVDEIVTSTEEQTTTKLFISKENIFVDEQGYFSEAGLVENMAQTAAAGTGYKAVQTNEAPTVGFIGQIKSLEIIQLPKEGDTIFTTVTNKHQVMNALIVDGVITLNDTVIAKAEYKIFLQQ